MVVMGDCLPPLLLRSTEGMSLSELVNSWRILFTSCNGSSFKMSLEGIWNEIIQLKSIYKGTLLSILISTHPNAHTFPRFTLVLSFLTHDPGNCCRGHRHRAEGRYRSTWGCFPGTHSCSRWAVCRYKPLYCHSHGNEMKCNIILLLLIRTWGKGLAQRTLSFSETGFFTA